MMPDYLNMCLLFIFGTIIGSFLNVCIARIPGGKSVVHPPSHCPKCKATIAFYDNLPLISYLLLGGKCRSCGEGISLRYPMVELLMGLLSLALYVYFGLGLAFVVGFILTAAMVVISFIDLDVRIVPDVISLPGIAVGLLFAVIGRYVFVDPYEVVPTPLSALVGLFVGGGFLFLLAWAYEAWTGVEGMGGGDIKLLAMIGAFLGWPAIPLTLFLASVGGAVIGLTAMAITGGGRRYAIPFAPFLCLGALAYLFFGPELISLYLPQE